MKVLIALCLLLVGAYCVSSSDPDWDNFKRHYGKKYRSATEESHRQSVFHDNSNTITQHNQKVGETYTLGMNEFGDLTNAEFNALMNGLKMPANVATSNRARRTSRALLKSLPPTVDWRPLGYVTPVKNQGQCGSCWAFSATGSLEGQYFAKTGTLTSLSEQNLVDCSGAYGNEGCNGGLMNDAFQYIQANNGIDTETSYPYQAVNGMCAFNATNVGATDTGFVNIASQSESALQNAIATFGPISVAIDASHNSFQLYKSGVYNERSCSSTSLDHGVLVVGYNITGGYYIVKNSWGTSWGMSGYIWMSLNKKNQCGIATMASYPTV